MKNQYSPVKIQTTDHEESVLSGFSLLSPTGLNMVIYKPNSQL